MRLAFWTLLSLTLVACAPPAALRGDALGDAEFDRLPDNEVVGYGDKEYHVDEVRDQVRAMEADTAAWDRANDAKAQATLTQLQTELAADEKARLARLNADAAADVARLRRETARPAGPARLDTGPDTAMPGQRVILAGAGLGAHRGTLRLVFSSGTHRFLPLRVEHWTPGWVAAVLPAFPGADGVGEPDQKAAFELATPDGRLLRWPVAFRAERAIAVVTLGDVARCSRAGYHDACRIGPGATLTGTHAVLFRERAMAGEDRAHIGLAHGWSTQRLDYAVRRWGYTTKGGSVERVEGCATGCAQTDIVVPWRVPGDYYGGVHYAVHLYINGPRGVAYR